MFVGRAKPSRRINSAVGSPRRKRPTTFSSKSAIMGCFMAVGGATRPTRRSGRSSGRSASRPVFGGLPADHRHLREARDKRMAVRGKVVITCAVTGAIHTPTMSPYLPLTPDEIAKDAIATAEAGAAILHLHARDPKDGRPTPDPDVFMQFLPRIKQSTGAVINITTGGGHGMTLEERLAAPLRAKPEMCSCNMGSMNFGLYPMLSRYKEWKYEWEPRYLEMTRDFIFRNTFADIERMLKELGEGCGTKFEFECDDVGHLYNLAP